MSAQGVRTAIASFLTTPGITGLEKVYLDQPWMTFGSDWSLSTNNGYGAVGWVHIDDEDETRIALPALTGQKQVDYQIGLVVLYQYLIPSATTGTSEDAWVSPLDSILDNIKARIRSDPTFGTGAGGVIFQAGQDAHDIKIARDLPRLDYGKVWSWQVVQFAVTEIVTA